MSTISFRYQHFESFLAVNAVKPVMERRGRSSVCEMFIGRNQVLGKFYQLQVILAEYNMAEVWNGQTCCEIFFVVKAFDPDSEDDPTVLWQGSETKLHFPDPEFRVRVVDVLVASVVQLLKDRAPSRVFFVAKSQTIPHRAVSKYIRIATAIEGMGYAAIEPTEAAHIPEGPFAWYFAKV